MAEACTPAKHTHPGLCVKPARPLPPCPAAKCWRVLTEVAKQNADFVALQEVGPPAPHLAAHASAPAELVMCSECDLIPSPTCSIASAGRLPQVYADAEAVLVPGLEALGYISVESRPTPPAETFLFVHSESIRGEVQDVDLSLVGLQPAQVRRGAVVLAACWEPAPGPAPALQPCSHSSFSLPLCLPWHGSSLAPCHPPAPCTAGGPRHTALRQGRGGCGTPPYRQHLQQDV